MVNNKSQSKEVAKQRLKLVLMHDRVDLSPGVLEMIREDIKQILSKYINIDQNGLDVELVTINERETPSPSAIVANIPLKSNRGI